MTTKEIAQAVSKTERSVQRWVKSVSVKMTSVSDKLSSSSPNKPADFTLDETLEIIEQGMGKNARLIYEQNAKKQPVKSDSDRLDRIDSILDKMLAVFDKVLPVVMENNVKQIESKPHAKIAYNPRIDINQRVRDYALLTRKSHGSVWNELYRELSYQLHMDLRRNAEEAGMSILDYIESIGEMESLLEVCSFKLV